MIVEQRRLPTAIDLEGVPIHPIRLHELLQWMEQQIELGMQRYVAYCNVYALNLAYSHAAFRAALQAADVVFCDGQGVRMGAALLGQHLPERFTPPDWIGQLMERCVARGYRVFLLGAQPGVAQQAAEQLQQRYPGLAVQAHHGYLEPNSREHDVLIEQINRFAPQVLLVGMGMPRQELWIQSQRAQLQANMLLPVGALFDYLSQTVQRGPRWLTNNGFEWLTRLWYEPRRLWRRYLLGNPFFVYRMVRLAVQRSISKRS